MVWGPWGPAILRSPEGSAPHPELQNRSLLGTGLKPGAGTGLVLQLLPVPTPPPTACTGWASPGTHSALVSLL